jgi:two-component system sensor histidine kinase BaeS
MITVTRAAATVRIEVADSAPGVPAGAYAKLFERLYRVEVSRSRGGGGSGLGLAICKNIVSAHAGSICAQPSTLGGVSVIIELPLDII